MATNRNPWPVLLVTVLGFFMIMLDTTIVYVATPSILSSLHASLDQVLWVFNGYLLTYAVLLITAGRLGDLFGPRQMFALGLIVFSAASALCGLSLDANQLIAARVIQGIGGPLIAPPAIAIVFGLIEGQRYEWGTITGWLSIPMVLAAGIALFVAFIAWQFRGGEPLVPLRLFRDRNFSLMNWTGLAMSFAMQGIFIPITIYTQSVLGMTPLQSGLTVAPMSLTAGILAPFAGRFADRLGGKYLLMAGLAIFGAGAGVVTLLATVNATQATFILPFVLTGLGLGLVFAPMTTVAMQDIKPVMAGAASGVLNTTRQLGAVIGAAAFGAILQNRLAVSLHDQAVASAGQPPPAGRRRLFGGFPPAARTRPPGRPGENPG